MRTRICRVRAGTARCQKRASQGDARQTRSERPHDSRPNATAARPVIIEWVQEPSCFRLDTLEPRLNGTRHAAVTLSSIGGGKIFGFRTGHALQSE